LRARGFTLLEVMVAVAILGLSLTVILSAQAGLYSGGTYAQHTSIATGLLRCRMSEIEERLLKLGFPEVEEKDDGACCEDDTRQDMRCTWQVDRVELPEAKAPEFAPSTAGSASAGPLGAISQIASNPQQFAGDAGISSLASALKEGTGGVAGIEGLAMSLVYPRLKPMLESSIRKVTVTIKWREGIRDRDITIVQYLTRPMRGTPLAGTMPTGTDPTMSGAPTPGGAGPGMRRPSPFGAGMPTPGETTP